MNELRRKLILVGGMAAIPLSTGCVTAALVHDATKSEWKTYQETVSSVLLSADGKTLAVIGQHYHYVFDAPESIKAVLHPELSQIVDASFTTFTVDRSQGIHGTYRLMIDKGATSEQKAAALAAGFKNLPNGDLIASGTLTGKRYGANGVQATKASQRLQKDYVITVSEDKGAGLNAAKLLLTPITLTVDGILILGTLPLLLIAAASKH